MQELPHRYSVQAAAGSTGEIRLASPGLPLLASAAPREFDGPGDRWAPETLLVAAVADCFVLSFRAVARASKLDWSSLECDAEGILDRVEGRMRFTDVNLRARLGVPAGTDAERARRLLEKAERSCLISNSLVARVHLEATVHES
jgi:peroxiredoxin-like protein